MKKKLLIIAACIASVSAYARLPLRIYSGAADTVFSASHTIVAVTEPGARASVNGSTVRVYENTGSFGARLSLSPGINKIRIVAEHGRQKADTTLRIFLADAAAPRKKANAADNTERPLPAPITVATDSGAYLQYGPAGDRLGGSKMCFLDSAIRLTAVAEAGSLYRVRLGENRHAFLPKEYCHAVEGSAPSGLATTGSWSIERHDGFDLVGIALPERIPYSYWTEDADPSVICIEIYGAADNSNWITQRALDLGIIDRVDFRQIDTDVYRVLIHLKTQYVWGFTVGYAGTSLRVRVRHVPDSDGLRGLHVGLDAGHGGPYPGARSPSGLLEKDLNLDIVLKLREMLLAAGAEVTLTRDSDTGPSMTERKRILRDAGVDISVSVHNNSGGGALASPGTAALYKHSFDRPFALAVARRLVELDIPLFGLVGNFNFSLNGPTDYPNMLVEGLFMSSLEEENLLADPEFRSRMARAVFLGISDYIEAAK